MVKLYDFIWLHLSLLLVNSFRWCWFTSNHLQNHQAFRSETKLRLLAVKPHNNLDVWCTFMSKRFSYSKMKRAKANRRRNKKTLRWLFKLWNGETLSGIQQSGFIGLGVDPIYWKKSSHTRHWWSRVQTDSFFYLSVLMSKLFKVKGNIHIKLDL